MAKKFLEKGLTKLVRTRPVIIITTLHPDGIVNAGTFGAYTNLSSDEIGIAIGKPSHTYQNIKRTGEFVINVVTRSIASASEICAREISVSESEIEQAGLTTEPSKKIAVPFIKESVSCLECKFEKEVEIGGYHSFIIGKCIAGHIEESVIDKDGGLDVIKAKAIFNIRYPDPVYAVLSNPFTV
ncbi:MAG: flavin reductase family protein [Candidatus Omnitrophota bacterium]|nr:flavin reductase family protein [Candidatus Omnitrophota bacterium]